MGEKTAALAQSERARPHPRGIEAGAVPFFPQSLIEPVVGTKHVAHSQWQCIGGQQPPAGPRLQLGRGIAYRRDRRDSEVGANASITRSQSLWAPTNQKSASIRLRISYFFACVIAISIGQVMASQLESRKCAMKSWGCARRCRAKL